MTRLHLLETADLVLVVTFTRLVDLLLGLEVDLERVALLRVVPLSDREGRQVVLVVLLDHHVLGGRGLDDEGEESREDHRRQRLRGSSHRWRDN